MWDYIFTNYLFFLMVFTRMSGMILFNPALGRKNVPAQLKIGLAFFISMIVTSTIGDKTIYFRGIPDFVFACFKELLIGFVVSFLFQMFLSSLLIAGELIDLQLGTGMSKVYDPSSNVSMPISGSVFNFMYMLLFFAGNGHLTFIKIMSLSFQILPAGTQLINFEVGSFVVGLFGNILILAVKLALPVIAIEFITEIGLGVLMRSVPQINVFAVGLQVKLLIGLVVIILILPGIAGLFDNMTNSMFEQIEKSLRILKGS
ncbi:MAG: flagellar biosynthetic protein FliR [Clostridiales bacterium 43-6]|nr:MAG: flagellar biosynthetic protein FliR [Clostridiales bacterium 43-6]